MKKALAIVLTLIGCLAIIALGVAAFLFWEKAAEKENITGKTEKDRNSGFFRLFIIKELIFKENCGIINLIIVREGKRKGKN